MFYKKALQFGGNKDIYNIKNEFQEKKTHVKALDIHNLFDVRLL